MSWFLDELTRARVRNAATPPHAQMVVTNPAFGVRTTADVAHNHPPNEPPCRERQLPGGGVRGECLPDQPNGYVMPLGIDFLRRGVPLCEHQVDALGSE